MTTHVFVGDDGSDWRTDDSGSWEKTNGKATPPEEGGVVLDATGWDLLCRYAAATSAMAMWSDERREAKEALVKILGPADHGHHGGRRVVSVIRTRPKRFNQSAFSEDHPGLLDQYREEPAEDEVRLTLVKDATFEASS
jgi:hypothetical protein